MTNHELDLVRKYLQGALEPLPGWEDDTFTKGYLAACRNVLAFLESVDAKSKQDSSWSWEKQKNLMAEVEKTKA